MQPAQPVAARVAETARPVVIKRVVTAHHAVGVNLEAGLLDAAAGAAVDPRVSLTACYLPALVIGVVIRSQVHVHREGDIPHAADTIVVFPHDRGWRVDVHAGPDRGTPDPRADFPHGAEEPQGRRELVPAVVEHQDAAAAAHLLELPFKTAHRHLPAAQAGSGHFHVVTADLAD